MRRIAVLFAVVATVAALTVEVRRRAWKTPSVEVAFS